MFGVLRVAKGLRPRTKCFLGNVCKTLILQTRYKIPDYKILYWSSLKAFANEKIYGYLKLKCVCGRVGKREHAGYQYFLIFSQCFQKASSLDSIKFGIMSYGFKPYKPRSQKINDLLC